MLNDKLEGLAIIKVEGEEKVSDASAFSGRKYKILSEGAGDLSVSFDFNASPNVISIDSKEGEQSFGAGYHAWETGTFKTPPFVSEKVAVSGAWVTPDIYRVKLVYFETPHILEYSFRFKGEQLYWERAFNVSMGPASF